MWPCRDQAQLWNRQSLVIHVHGAALGSWAFLPHGAAVVQVVTRPAGVVHDNQFAQQLERDLAGVTGVTFFPANNTDMSYVRLRGEEVFGQPQWQQLTAEQKVRQKASCCCSAACMRLFLPGRVSRPPPPGMHTRTLTHTLVHLPA